MNDQTEKPPVTAKLKRTRKPSTPRTRKPKDAAILAIEQEAADKKAQYRKAQQSGGIFTRILKLVARLTVEDKNKLADALKPVATPSLPLE